MGEKLKIKTTKTRAEIIEIVVVVLLGLVTLLTAWASWIGSLHGGNQATNYTKSNNLASEGNSMWNEAVQDLASDTALWQTISDLRIDYAFAEEHHDAEAMEKIDWKLEQLLNDQVSDELLDAINWADEQEEYASPFDMEGFTESYFLDAQAALDESQEVLAQGQKDNEVGDAFGLVTVIYSIALFLLGILSSFKSEKNQIALIIISLVAVVFTTVYMMTLDMPTGFSLASFFGG